jgi:hypothetical protein
MSPSTTITCPNRRSSYSHNWCMSGS